MLSYSAESVFDALYLGILGRTPDAEARARYLRMLDKAELDLPGLVEEVLGGRGRQKPYFTATQSVDAIYFAALGKLPDNDTRAALAERISMDSRSDVLSSIGAELYNSEHRFTVSQAVDAIYFAALGKLPDNDARAALAERASMDSRGDVLSSIGAALYNNAEHQHRLLPENVSDRVLVDHSPNGEFFAMLRLFLGANGRGLMVEVGLPTPSASYSIDFLKLSGWRGLLIEPSPELRSSIEARFSGTDYELIQARVEAKTAESYEAGWRTAGALALAELDDAVTGNGGLASVLANANVPTDFEILAVSNAVRTSEVINDLIGSSEYRPALILAELQPPLNWTDLAQLGLSEKTGQDYEVGFSTDRSVFLVRR
jgi:hypothetical protein